MNNKTKKISDKEFLKSIDNKTFKSLTVENMQRINRLEYEGLLYKNKMIDTGTPIEDRFVLTHSGKEYISFFNNPVTRFIKKIKDLKFW